MPPWLRGECSTAESVFADGEARGYRSLNGWKSKVQCKNKQVYVGENYLANSKTFESPPVFREIENSLYSCVPRVKSIVHVCLWD